jgi:hypothetical protein
MHTRMNIYIYIYIYIKGKCNLKGVAKLVRF